MEIQTYEEAKKIILEMRSARASLLQRRLKINYIEAAQILECLENEGFIGPNMSPHGRKILFKK